jgi:hypothetical protein
MELGFTIGKKSKSLACVLIVAAGLLFPAQVVRAGVAGPVTALPQQQVLIPQLERAQAIAEKARTAGISSLVSDSGVLHPGVGIVGEVWQLADNDGRFWVFAETYQLKTYFGSITPRPGTTYTMMDVWATPTSAAVNGPAVHVANAPAPMPSAGITGGGILCVVSASILAVLQGVICQAIPNQIGQGACQTGAGTADGSVCLLPDGGGGGFIAESSLDCSGGGIAPKGCDIKAESIGSVGPSGAFLNDVHIWVNWYKTETGQTSWESSVCSATFTQGQAPNDGCATNGGAVTACGLATPGIFSREGVVCDGTADVNLIQARIVSQQPDCEATYVGVVYVWADFANNSEAWSQYLYSPVRCG